MKRILAILFPVILLAWTAGTAGCEEDEESTYDVTVVWEIGGQKGICEQPLASIYGGGTLYFETIWVNLYKDAEDTEPYRKSSTPCSSGSFVIEDIEGGTYFVELEAMADDPEKEVVPDAGQGDAGVIDTAPRETRAYYVASGEIVVPARDDEEYSFSLKMGTGSIEVSWDFEEGGQCNAEWNMVERVKVTLTGDLHERSPIEVACNVGNYAFTDLDWDIYEVSVEGFDANGNTTHLGQFDLPIEIRPGMRISGKDGLIHLTRVSP